MKSSWVFSSSQAVLITVIYFFAGALWALFSDDLFSLLFYQTAQQKHAVIYSHWFFVVLSSVILYGFLRYWNTTQFESKESLQVLHRTFNSFSECIKVIAKAEDEKTLLQDVCRICVEVGGHRLAWIAFAENDPQKTLSAATHWGEKSCFLECLNATWSNTERGQGPAGTCIRTGEPVVFQNLMENQRYKPWQGAAKKCNFASCIALPLHYEQQTFGALVILNALPNAFDGSEIRLLKELASDLSYGIKNLRLKAARTRELEERLMLAAVTDQTSDGVITFDGAGIIQYMNPSFVSLCGIPADQGVGVSIHNFECSQRNHMFYQSVLEVFRTNKVKKGQFINKKRDGTEYEIDARISPVFNQSHQVVRYVATIRDISQEAKLARQLRQAQKMEAVASLSGGIASDFKNILGTIMADSELALEQNPQAEQQQRLMLSIYKAALRGKGLIHKFMTISRQSEQPKQIMSIEEVVRDSMKLLASTFPTTIKIKIDISDNIGKIKGDPGQIQQVIMNICSNAKDTMPGSGNVLEVNLSNTEVPIERQGLTPDLQPGQYIVMSITDTGYGLEPDELDRIFDPFYKIKGQKESSGLGLSVAHSIVKNHGGHISVNSIAGIGTNFVVLFPSVEALDKQEILLDKKESQRRILFVGAEQEALTEMKNALIQLGYFVQAEIEGREALERFHQREGKYDLIIADQEMPDMSGEMFIREAHTTHPEIPVILCSEPEHVTELSKEQLYSRENLILKPYATDEVCQTVQNILQTG